VSDVESSALVVTETYADFDDYWEPFLAGIGPAGSHAAALDGEARAQVREECFRRLGEPSGSFTLDARAWAVRGRA
jgi:hypothetical protein